MRPLIAVVLMVAITVVLAAVLYSGSQSMSPEIYLYSATPVMERVAVTIREGVTATSPDVGTGRAIEWNGVSVGPDGMNYRGEALKYLYYEGIFEYDSAVGWVFERDGGKLTVNGMPATSEAAEIKRALLASGLFENEAEDFLAKLCGEMGAFDGASHRTALKYIPEDVVNERIQITTTHDFAQIRRHFLLVEDYGGPALQSPEFGDAPHAPMVLHEWALNRG